MARPFKTRDDERDVFRALAHPVRRLIVSLALDQQRSFAELKNAVRRSEPALSAHLRILRQAAVIRATRTGRAVTYRTNPRALRSAATWLSEISAATVKFTTLLLSNPVPILKYINPAVAA